MTPYLSNATFLQNTLSFLNKASVALNPLVSLIGRLVARSGRKRGKRQTDRQNDIPSAVFLTALFTVGNFQISGSSR